MSVQSVIVIVLQASIFAVVFSFGLASRPGDAAFLLRRPALLVRSLLAMFVVMPLVVVGAHLLFDLPPAVMLALFILALSPVPPLLPQREAQAGASAAYGRGLLLTAAILAVGVMPAGLLLASRGLGLGFEVRTGPVAGTVAWTVVLPFVGGLLVNLYAPTTAARVRGPLQKIALGVLVLGALPILFVGLRAVPGLLGNGTLVALVAFVVVGLAVGHFLGGPVPEERSVLALSTAARHPAIALGVAAASFPQVESLPALILLYLLVNAIVSIPYLRRRRRGGAVVGPVRKPA